DSKVTSLLRDYHHRSRQHGQYVCLNALCGVLVHVGEVPEHADRMPAHQVGARVLIDMASQEQQKPAWLYHRDVFCHVADLMTWHDSNKARRQCSGQQHVGSVYTDDNMRPCVELTPRCFIGERRLAFSSIVNKSWQFARGA